jgi:peptidoglycan/xylan/chitin deacetylase (PgdA/CDA1 family)
MPPKRDLVPRAKAAGGWLGGILLLGILGGGVVAAAVLLWENLDVRQLAPALAVSPGPLPEPDLPRPAGLQHAPFSAALLHSARNEAYFPDGAFYSQALARWRRLVEGVGGNVREVRSVEDLRGLSVREVLVVPEAPCLSSGEIAAIRAHLGAGGGLVSNWAVGARDERCEWRGWQTVAELTDAGDVRELPARQGLFLTVPAGLPLSQGLDPGTRIELRPEPTLALHRLGPRVYWSDWALNPAPDESGGGADVAALAGTLDGGGRTAWLGFRLSQAATVRDSILLERLAQNGVLWAAGLPTATAAPWPEGRRAALLIVQDVEAEQRNALALAALLQDMEVPGTFFAVSRAVLDDVEMAQALSAAGEVGSHTSDHAPVAGLSHQDQLVRLRRTWTEIRGWADSEPHGLRPPEESFDANTLQAWWEVGGRYVVAVNQARSGSPEVHRVGEGFVILIPRLLKDDYNVFVQEGAIRTDRLTGAFLEGVRKLRSIGGVAVVGVHTQILGTDRRLEAVRTVADTARAQGDWWIARAGEVAEWWGRRASVRVTVVPASGPETTLESRDPAEDSLPTGASDSEGDVLPWHARHPDILVQAPEMAGIQGLWIDVTLPGGSDAVLPQVDGSPVGYVTTEWGIRVPVGDLAAGQARRISLRGPGR